MLTGTRGPAPVAYVCPSFVYERTEEDERGDMITFITRFNEGFVDLNYQPGILQCVPTFFKINYL